MKRLCLLFTTLLGLLLSSLSCTARKVDNTPVPIPDINCFLGCWYENARFEHSFEHGMTHCTAYYCLRDDGLIRVENHGYKEGERSISVGKAKLTDESGRLRVSFFGPFYADYRVLMLDDGYRYALVGSSSDDYLWIISRTPQLSDDVKRVILAEAQRRGYDTSQLIWVDHNTDVF